MVFIMKLKLLVVFFLILGSLGAAEENFYNLEDDKKIWTYYSVNESFEGVSNSINMIVENKSSEVNNILSSDWRSAQGTDRYIYIEKNEEGEWREEYAQLEKGNYYSIRNHLRLYDAGNNTVIQGHREFWNWFTLSHEVVSNEKARSQAENDLAEHGEVEEEYVGNEGFLDSDGYLSVISLAIIGIITKIKSKQFKKLFRSLKDYKKQIKLSITILGTFLIIKTIPVILEPQTSINNHIITFVFYILFISSLPILIGLLSSSQTLKDTYSLILTFLIAFAIDSIFFQTSITSAQYYLQFFGFSIILALIPAVKKKGDKKPYKIILWIISYLGWLFLMLLGFI